jgi:hypothetical protein
MAKALIQTILRSEIGFLQDLPGILGLHFQKEGCRPNRPVLVF